MNNETTLIKSETFLIKKITRRQMQAGKYNKPLLEICMKKINKGCVLPALPVQKSE